MLGPAYGLSQVANGVLAGMDSAHQENQRQANVDREFGLRQQAEDRAQSVTDAQLGQIQRANEMQDASLSWQGRRLPVDPAITAHIFQGHGMTDPSQPQPDQPQPQATGLVQQAAPAAGDAASTPDADTGDDDGGDDATDGSPDADAPEGSDAGVQSKQALTLSEGAPGTRGAAKIGLSPQAQAGAVPGLSTPKAAGLKQQVQPVMPWDMLRGQAQQVMGQAQQLQSQADALLQQHPEYSDRQKQIIRAQANSQIQVLVGQAQQLAAQAQGGQRAAYTKQAAAFLANGDVESATPYLQATGIDPRTFSGLQFEKGKDGTVTGRYLLPGGRILTQAMLQNLADPDVTPDKTVAAWQKVDDLLRQDRHDQQQNAIEQGRLEVERRNAATNAYRASVDGRQAAKYDPKQRYAELSVKQAMGKATPAEQAELNAIKGIIPNYEDKASNSEVMALKKAIQPIWENRNGLSDEAKAAAMGPLLQQLNDLDPSAASTYGTAVYDNTPVTHWVGSDTRVGWKLIPPTGNAAPTTPAAPNAMAQNPAPTTGLRQGAQSAAKQPPVNGARPIDPRAAAL